MSLGIFIGLAIAFVIWRWEIRNKIREEMAFDLYIDFLKLCNQGDEKEAEKARSRNLQFFVRRGWNAAAFQPRFESRVEESCRIAKVVGEQKTSKFF